MPDPGKYSSNKEFMDDCMHVTKQEGLNLRQRLGKCLGMWRGAHGTAEVGPAPKKKKGD